MDNQVVRNDVTHLTPQIAMELASLRVEALHLDQVRELSAESLLALGSKSGIRNIFFGGLDQLSADVALVLASGYQSSFHFAGITELSEGIVRILATWKRGWFSMPNARKIALNPELLRLSVLCDNLSMVRILVRQAGMHPDTPFRDGMTSLLLAGKHLNSVLIRELIELGANPNQVTHHEQESLLHFAARARSRGLIKYLIEHVDKGLVNCNRRTAYDEYDEQDEEIRQLLRNPKIK